MALLDKVAAVSSTLLRLLSYIFLRWIPGHPFPPIIYTLLAIYLPAVVVSFLNQPAYQVLADKIQITQVDNRVISDDDDDEEEDEEREPLLYPPYQPLKRIHQSPISNATGHVEEEIIVEETVLLARRSSKPWRTILTGLASPTSKFLTLATVLVNIVLALAVTDYVYRGNLQYPSHELSFARIGYVSNSEAAMLLREPDSAKWPVEVDIRIKDIRENNVPNWQHAGTIVSMDQDTDYTAALPLTLRQGVQLEYEWCTSNGHNGSFQGGSPSGNMPLQAKRSNTLSFLTSSCIIPNFPYNPLEHPLAIPGFRHMSQLLPKLNAQFMLFLGDFIYIDVPKRFGATVEDYRRKYRQIYASPDWPLVSNLSWIHVLDDHEIANDYDLGQETVEYKAAVDPFYHYQASINPPTVKSINRSISSSSSSSKYGDRVTWYGFDSGPAMFFMMDTRSYRDKNHEQHTNSTSKSMLGPAQLADLLHFLHNPPPPGIRWKIVVSSIPFTQNWGGPSGHDTWAGFLAERQKILEAMWEAGSYGTGIIVLSGDRHEFAATAFPPPPGSSYPESVTVHEYSTSPLSQFYLPIPTYKERGDDRMIKYIPHGNSKFAHLECVVEGMAERSTCTFVLYIDGVEAWRDVLLSPRAEKNIKDKGRTGLVGVLERSLYASLNRV